LQKKSKPYIKFITIYREEIDGDKINHILNEMNGVFKYLIDKMNKIDDPLVANWLKPLNQI
jgi:hypothetical protein